MTHRALIFILIAALSPACMVTRAVHTLLATPYAPEQAPELERAPGEDVATLWIVTEDGARHRALTGLALPPDLPEEALRARQEQGHPHPSLMPSLVRERSHAEDHRVEVKRAKDWEVLARVPGIVEQPGFLGTASAWLLTPAALVVDTPINFGLFLAVGVALILDELS